MALVAAGAIVLAAAPDRASYAADLLPGLLAIGFGTGLVFPSASVAAMHDVGHNEAGLAAGMLSTAHELGAALGVAVLAAVAGAGGAAGYEDGFLVAAGIAVASAAVALVAAPSVKPAPGARAMAH